MKTTILAAVATVSLMLGASDVAPADGVNDTYGPPGAVVVPGDSAGRDMVRDVPASDRDARETSGFSAGMSGPTFPDWPREAAPAPVTIPGPSR